MSCQSICVRSPHGQQQQQQQLPTGTNMFDTETRIETTMIRYFEERQNIHAARRKNFNSKRNGIIDDEIERAFVAHRRIEADGEAIAADV